MIWRQLYLIGCVILMQPAAASESQSPKPDPSAFPVAFGGPFELVDHNGKLKRDSDYAGQFMLVYFGYSYCPDICPTDLYKIGQAVEAADPKARIQPLFVTVDPERDRPEILKEYVANFHSRLIGMSGTEAQIRKAAKAYRVHRMKVPQMDGEDYLVNHSSLAYLMGPDGRFLSLIPHGTETDRITQILKKYLAQAES